LNTTNPPHIPKIIERKEIIGTRYKEGTPLNKTPKLGATSTNPKKIPKGGIIMANHYKSEITTFEPITLAHYMANMDITLTIDLKSQTING
jgi:hypothetical protein